MARQRQYDTPSAILRRLNEGRGFGKGSHFKPWMEAKDVSSRGRRHRLKCVKAGRVVHLLSDVERDALFVAEYTPEVVGIREQYPLLPLSETQQIAEELKIPRHPTSPRTGFPIVMTTDQLWDLRHPDGSISEIAINVKYVDERGSHRNQEKRRIEEQYHARRDRTLVDFDELFVTRDFRVNWGFVRTLLRPEYADAARAALAAEIDLEFRGWVESENPHQAEIVSKAALHTGAPKRQVIAALHLLIARLNWPVDIFSGRLGPSLPYKFLVQ